MKNILIIGSGIAGLSTAIHCAEKGHRAILVSPYPSERSQSVMAAGGINAALNTKGEGDSPQHHVEDTIRGGCYLASRRAVMGMCEAAPALIRKMEQMGAVFTRDSEGRVDLRSFGGQAHKRTAYAGASTGKQLVSALVLKAREYEAKGAIRRFFGLYFYSALIREGECFGALFFNECTRALEAICADAVVMATGGQNALFGKTTGSTLCDGYAAGKLFLQGVLLKNLEFIQYHPTTLETPQKRMLISEAARGEGGRLYYLDGEKRVYFMEEKFGPRGNLMPRDVVSRHIYDAPSQVYLDLTHLGKELIRSRLMEVKELCLRYGGIDVERESIPVYPSVHFFMGGIRVDEKHRTNIRRLFAVGECASQYHGANRLGGNSLLAALYGGQVVSEAVADLSSAEPYDATEEIKRETATLEEIIRRTSDYPAVYLRRDLEEVIRTCLGITRTEEKLAEGLKSVDYYLSVSDKIHFDSGFSPYQSYSTKALLVLARAVFLCAKNRCETRGAHIREDYPETRESFASATVISYDGGEYTIRYEKEDSL